jgi:hypothetical protein
VPLHNSLSSSNYILDIEYIHSRLIRSSLIPIISLLLFSAISYFLPAAESATYDHILVNEVELNPPSNDNQGGQKVELYNPSNSTVNVTVWTISSREVATATMVINNVTTISPNATWNRFTTTMAR